ncbi:hypothetical protein PRIPAC_90898 [Pristionchus pacificus]|uniref:Uncharacterized protein n=1 Tax=Pristionchus pacificus TaxID=54126 RepID=A0A2A6CVW6_PRIPA|nr:hypothetical protein PRIPAC_90898 [Pristionchus pacificus]|eukprot:PDM82183.1 hypothetical protein PRIPAC_36576 [Pristionchus pacificus]
MFRHYKELQKSSTEEIKALQERYITALATASEKTNRAKETIAERDTLRKRKNEIVAEEVERAMEQFENEKSDLLDDLKNAKENLQIVLNEANRRLEMTEKQMRTIKRERDFFDRIVSENASVDDSLSPPEVDPFALLTSCEGAKRKVPEPIAAQFDRLRAAYEKCNKKRLADQTWGLFDAFLLRGCDLCKVPLEVNGVRNFIDHICGKKHSTKLEGIACADAFDFWLNAIETATYDDPLKQTTKWVDIATKARTMSGFEKLKSGSEKTTEMMKRKVEAENERVRFTQLEKEMEEMKLFWADLGEEVSRKRPRTESIKEEPEDDVIEYKEDDEDSAEEGEVVDWEVKTL